MADDQLTPADIQVMRIAYPDLKTLKTLRRMDGFRGLDWREGYAVFELYPPQVNQYRQAGWKLQPDVQRQAALAQWLAMDYERALRGNPGTIPGYSCYRTVTQTIDDLEALAAAHPDLAEIQVIGSTWQQQQGSADGDDIVVMILRNQASPHPQAPLVVMAAQHARELATAEIATRFAETLLQQQAVDPDIRWLLDHRAIHIIAQLNPDGRRQVESGAAFWRKNNNETACPGGNLSTSWPGIDLNRNSSFLWGNQSSSGNPCSQVYRGTVASSEPETQSIQSYLASVFAAQRPATDLTSPAPDDTEGLFISIHSFGELVLLPWEGLGGTNNNNAPNHDQLTVLGRKFGFFTDYAVGRWQLLGPAGGTTTDFAYGEFGVAAYTFEVGTTFQQSCSSFEQTIWPVNRDALIYAARAARRPYQTPFGPDIVELNVALDGDQLSISGQAADHRYFRGSVTEPPASDPVANIVQVEISLGVPPYLADQTWTIPVQQPAPQVEFSGSLPPGIPLQPTQQVFVVAVDADGAIGVPAADAIDSAFFQDGFEAP